MHVCGGGGVRVGVSVYECLCGCLCVCVRVFLRENACVSASLHVNVKCTLCA